MLSHSEAANLPFLDANSSSSKAVSQICPIFVRIDDFSLTKYINPLPKIWQIWETALLDDEFASKKGRFAASECESILLVT
jgi:hypothetical protein